MAGLGRLALRMFCSTCVVTLRIVDPAESRPKPAPISVFRALSTGFDRVTARPLLLLPPLLLDLLLWLGPRLGIRRMIEVWSEQVFDPATVDPMLTAQAQAVQAMTAELALRFSLMIGLSPAPGGVPSLMAARLPLNSPVGGAPPVQVEDPLAALGMWLAFIVLGLGIGAAFNRLVASQVAQPQITAPLGRIWLRFIWMTAALYLGIVGVGMVLLLVAAVAALITPMLSFFLVMGGMGLLFWLAVYLAFTPHGIVRYGFGLVRAMAESMLVVRFNLLAALGFLAVSSLIGSAANLVWAMPREDSWLTMLAVVGHAFVSAMLLTGSYAFYQSRHDWMTSMRPSRRPGASEVG
jgi:hypothetical protein